MKAVVRIDPKGRITIPLYIREAIGLEPFSYVEVEVSDNGKSVVIRPISKPGEVLVDIRASLKTVEDFTKLLELILAEGAEIRLLKCRSVNGEGYDCVFTLTLLDKSLAEYIGKKIQDIGIKVTIT